MTCLGKRNGHIVHKFRTMLSGLLLGYMAAGAYMYVAPVDSFDSLCVLFGTIIAAIAGKRILTKDA